MFDDSKRLDKLESQMASVEKSIKDLATSIDNLAKSFTAKTKEYDNSNEDKDRQFLGIRKARLEPLETDSKAHATTLKTLSQRVATLEVQMKKLSK